MSIFQKSVLNKHINNLDKEKVDKAFLQFKTNYSLDKIEKIKLLKEEEYQDGFLREIFVDVLGYTFKPNENYNLVREFKNQSDSKKADGAILNGEKVVAVIELKSTSTKDLTSVTQQAFNYKNNQPGCKYVITSNFQKLRFFIDYSNEYEEFDLFNLQKQEFDLLYMLLHKDSIFADLPQTIKKETRFHEQQISEQLYNDYSDFKYKIFENLVKNNPEYDKITLFEKSQKLLDRLLFIFFAEDSGLLPANSISRIIDHFDQLRELDAYKPLYETYKLYFGYMNIGRKGKVSADDIPAYNGGLFAPDEVLDNVKIDDEILRNDSLKLSKYDFNTEVDVNILGHIFEHSLNEIEEFEKQLAENSDISVIKTSKRKKDGVFYTPKYITQYIVENTLGKLCENKRKELGIFEIEFDSNDRTKKGLSEKGKAIYNKLNDYKEWLKSLKIIDPACGSGAFLNQALNFLIAEHKLIDDLIADLTNQAIRLFDTDKSILENNLFGVDINQESVEIAKLSLWLRTAQKERKLSNLNDNIKCGNSLIDVPEIAGEKAFNWQKEFPQIIENGGFDVVVGNPPYGAKLETEVQDYLNKQYIKGGSETAISFIKLSYDKLLKSNGLFGFIIPKAFTFASNYENIRDFLINDITEIIDCKKVWKEVLLEQIMLFYQKNINSNFYKNGKLQEQSVTILSNLQKENYKKFDFLLNDITLKELEIGLNINNLNFFIKDIANNSRGGIFQKKITDIGNYAVLGGAEIQRNGIVGIKGKIDYELIKNDTKNCINENSILVQNIVAHIENPTPHIKITACFPENKNYAIVDTINQITFHKDYNCKVFWLLFNSKLINWYCYRFIFAKAIRTMHFDNSITNRIPIPKYINQQTFIEKADLMLQLYKELQEKSDKFIRNIQREFLLLNISKKLQNWYEITYTEFLKELEKQKIKLSLSQKSEWEDYFLSECKKTQEINDKIKQTDIEIDNMVYKLYELTPEEIEIVEEIENEIK